MKNNRMSVATIREPEFVNITSISPLISKCNIKVLYLGENRNRSFISREVAEKMAQTLPGTPIVGYWSDSKEDYTDHGEVVTIDERGITFEDKTKPFGFVAPDAKVWFQTFVDTDEFGNEVEREYLVTEGYLWTEQYKQCKQALENENPHSMKLQEETLKGHWSTNSNTGVEFFIINDAIFENLCILGVDVEPCFEGCKITAPTFSSKDEAGSTVVTLFSMIQELKETLEKTQEGGTNMELENLGTVADGEVSTVAEGATDVAEPVDEGTPAATEGEVKAEEAPVAEPVEPVADPAPVEGTPADTFEKEDKEDEKDKEDNEEKNDENKDKIEEDESKKKYNKLEEDYESLKVEYSALLEEVETLRSFKATVETEKKDALIASFTMLSDEDKADVIANKDTYSYDDIEAKLSIICVRNKVSFAEDKSEKVEPINTFKIEDEAAVPAFVQALRNSKKK
jgi:hypothetical protein